MRRLIKELREILTELVQAPNALLFALRAPVSRRRYRNEHLRGWFVVRQGQKVCFLRCESPMPEGYRFVATDVMCSAEELTKTLDVAFVWGGKDVSLRNADGATEIRVNEDFIGGVLEDGSVVLRDMRPL